jgi:hypothetical protein
VQDNRLKLPSSPLLLFAALVWIGLGLRDRGSGRLFIGKETTLITQQ